jgi:uncharacterized Zn finger protein
MQCGRCAGMRVPEIIFEGGARIIAMRCVHCGDVIDRVIVMNRQRRRYAQLGRPQTSIKGCHRRTWSRPVRIEES